MPIRTANATWEGTLKEGRGSMGFGSGVWSGPFTWSTRFAEEPGTNPEELIGAAQAGCFSMFLAAQLANAGFPAESIHSTAKVHLEGTDVTLIEVTTEVTAPGLDQATFDEKVLFSKDNCPISKALKAVPHQFSATLKG